MKIRKNKIWIGILYLSCCLLLIGCEKKQNQSAVLEKEEQKEDKGYDLTVPKEEAMQAEQDSNAVMECYQDLYFKKRNNELTETDLLDMCNQIAKHGYCVKTTDAYSELKHYEVIDDFLLKAKEGMTESVVLFELNSDGGLTRQKFFYDGKDMYVLASKCDWNNEEQPTMTYISYTRVMEWYYCDNGWFCFQLCVPQPPEVSEVVDGGCFIRIKPLADSLRKMTKRLVRQLGYQGNNILCSNWNTDHMEELDYNGMYEYLYRMKYGETFPSGKYTNGIPKEEFESLIMEYFPITKEQIQEYASFNEENQTYDWVQLGCFNYAPNYFGTSLPEVVNIQNNEDDTVTLTVEAVNDMVIQDNVVITHELTVKFVEDGRFQYLGNEILNHGIENIPEYQYRIE